MTKSAHPLKIQIFRPQGEESVLAHIAEVREAELTPLVNGVRVACCKQRWGGVSRAGRLDALIEPIKQCACAPRTPEDEERMKRLGCIVSEFTVRLESAGATVFEQTLPMARLTPIAWGLYNRLGLGNGQNEEEKRTFLWRLTADFLSPPPAPSPHDDDDEDAIVLDDPEPPLCPGPCPRPTGRVVGEVAAGDLPIYVQGEALDALLRHAQDAPDDLEIGGALLGQVGCDEQGVFVVVEETPLLMTEGSTYSVTFGWLAFQQVRERLRDREGRALLGLWHVHPASFEQAFASQQDVWGFQTFFPEPWNIFAVVGRTLERTAFFQWTEDGQVRSAGFYVADESRVERKKGE